MSLLRGWHTAQHAAAPCRSQTRSEPGRHRRTSAVSDKFRVPPTGTLRAVAFEPELRAFWEVSTAECGTLPWRSCHAADDLADVPADDRGFDRVELFSLRERGEDVIEIAYSLLGYMSVEEGKAFVRFAQEVLDRFNQYEWPGNVRQLQNVLRNVVVLNNGKEITLNMLPPPLNQPIESSLRLKEMQNEDITVKDIFPLWITEKTAIEQAIKACDGNIPRAAGFLDVSPSTIYRKLQTWNAKQ